MSAQLKVSSHIELLQAAVVPIKFAHLQRILIVFLSSIAFATLVFGIEIFHSAIRKRHRKLRIVKIRRTKDLVAQ